MTSCSAPPAAPPIHSADDTSGNGDSLPTGEHDPAPEPTPGPVTNPITQMPSPTPGPAPLSGQSPMPMPAPAPTPTPVVISNDGDGRFEVGPNYKDDEATKSRGAMKGTWKEFTMNGSDSVVFKGNYTRKVRVYFPPDFKKEVEYPFMIAMDANFWLDPLKTTLDNLIVDNKVPAMIGVYVDNGGGDSRGSQRGLEYDTVGPNNAKFLETEVMARIEKDYAVKFTKDPEGGGLFGGSSSGVAAFTAAWFAPQRFRKVLAYSATFTAQGADKTYPEGGFEYQKHIIKESGLKPIRVSLEAGQNDNKFFNDTLVANEDTFKELKAKGNHVRFHYGKSAGHVDGGVMRQTIAENLIWLWRDYPRK